MPARHHQNQQLSLETPQPTWPIIPIYCVSTNLKAEDNVFLRKVQAYSTIRGAEFQRSGRRHRTRVVRVSDATRSALKTAVLLTNGSDCVTKKYFYRKSMNYGRLRARSVGLTHPDSGKRVAIFPQRSRFSGTPNRPTSQSGEVARDNSASIWRHRRRAARPCERAGVTVGDIAVRHEISRSRCEPERTWNLCTGTDKNPERLKLRGGQKFEVSEQGGLQTAAAFNDEVALYLRVGPIFAPEFFTCGSGC